MKITAITKFKNAILFEALEKLGWNQNELARKTNLDPSQVGRIINMQNTPTQAIANKIQAALGEQGVFIDMDEAFPKGFNGFGKRSPKFVQTKEVSPHSLIEYQQNLMEECNSETKYLVVQALGNASISEREKEAITLSYLDSQTDEEISKVMNVHRGTVSMLRRKGMGKIMRNSWNMKLFKEAKLAMENDYQEKRILLNLIPNKA